MLVRATDNTNIMQTRHKSSNHFINLRFVVVFVRNIYRRKERIDDASLCDSVNILVKYFSRQREAGIEITCT